MLETAHAAASKATQLGNSAARIQTAKLYWMENQKSVALRLLSESIDDPQIYPTWHRRQQANVSQCFTMLV